MASLIAASLLWAFSFGLIKTQLDGCDPLLVAFLRLSISTAVFLPWLSVRRFSVRLVWLMVALGAVQFGLMYACYIASFSYLPAWAVALFTIFTPLYVVFLVDTAARRFSWRHLAGAFFAIAGAGLVLQSGLPAAAAWPGILLLQVANLCFAIGQVAYRRVIRVHFPGGAPPEAGLLAWMYVGAALVTGLAALPLAGAGLRDFDGTAWLALLYLGIIPTGLGFYLWNRGAARAGAGVLAVANNLKIPLAVLCSWLVFREQADYPRVMAGLAIVVAALFVAGSEKPDN